MQDADLHLATLRSQEDSLEEVFDGLVCEEAHQESVELD
jgi:hypothetical protein